MTQGEASNLSDRELLLHTLKEVSDIKERLIRMEEREKIQDTEEHRKQSCPWADILIDMGHSLQNGGKRFDSQHNVIDNHEDRLRVLENIIIKRETQGGVLGKLFEWAWKLGIIALLGNQVAKWLGFMPPM